MQKMPMQRMIVWLVAMAAILAAVAFWHGATDSSESRTALYLLPYMPVIYLFGFALRRSWSRRH